MLRLLLGIISWLLLGFISLRLVTFMDLRTSAKSAVPFHSGNTEKRSNEMASLSAWSKTFSKLVPFSISSRICSRVFMSRFSSQKEPTAMNSR